MSIHIQTADGLKPLASNKITQENVVEALDYTPANKTELDAHIVNEDIHTTAADKAKWNAKSDFSGNYNDLTNKPDIIEDGSDNLVIADPDGNVIFKVDSEGVHTTALEVDGIDVGAALQNVADNADLDAHLTNTTVHITESERTAWNNKSDFSGNYNDLADKPNITEDGSAEINIVDNDGNIIFKVDADGAQTTELTLGTGDTAVKVTEKLGALGQDISLVNVALSGHTEDTTAHITAAERDTWNAKVDATYVDTEIANLVNSAPDKLNTLDELAAALGDDENFATTVTTQIASKANKTDLDGHITNTSNPHNVTATQVGLGLVDNTSDMDKPVSTATQEALDGLKTELSESIVSESKEWIIADEEGNIVAKVDENGLETTTVTADAVVVNGVDVEENLITPIDSQYVRITDLETGIYKLNSQFLRYKGKTDDTIHYIESFEYNYDAPLLLFVNKLMSSWSWYYIGGGNGSNPFLIVAGTTTESTGTLYVIDGTMNKFATCRTAADTAAKAVTMYGGSTTAPIDLVPGVRLSVLFSYANTASTPTLNLNGKGAKNIYHNGAQITTDANKSLLNGVCDFVYDGTQWHLVGNYIDTTYGDATTTEPGLMSAKDKLAVNWLHYTSNEESGGAGEQLKIAETADDTNSFIELDTNDGAMIVRGQTLALQSSSENINITSGTYVNISAPDGIDIECGSGGSISLDSDNCILLNAVSDIDVTADVINLYGNPYINAFSTIDVEAPALAISNGDDLGVYISNDGTISSTNGNGDLFFDTDGKIKYRPEDGTYSELATKSDIDNTKSELSESIVSESTEWTIIDTDGNIVSRVDSNGLETTTVTAQSVVVNGEEVAVKSDIPTFTYNSTTKTLTIS